MKRSVPFIVLLFALLVTPLVQAQEPPLKVMATTTIVADVAQNVAGDLFTVQSLLPPNTDTHAYEPTPNDAIAVAEANLLLTVGGGYESFLSTLLQNAGGDVKTVELSDNVAILAFGEDHDHHDEATAAPDATEAPHSEYLGVLGQNGLECDAHEHEDEEEASADEHEHGTCDPHVWMDPKNVAIWTSNIAAAFAEIDPAHADTYQANAQAYIAKLDQLDMDVRAILAPLPPERRVLVTNHDFLGYFAHAYDFEIVGNVIPSISSTAEADPQQLAQLIDVIQARQVPAIFVEVSGNSRQAQSIADEAHVKLVDTLYAEALSAPGAEAGTYIDFLKFDAQTIADALK